MAKVIVGRCFMSRECITFAHTAMSAIAIRALESGRTALHHVATFGLAFCTTWRPAPSAWDASTRKNVTANDCGSFEGRSARNSVGYQWGTTQRKLVPVVSALRCCP
jgi:hypothetical protein